MLIPESSLRQIIQQELLREQASQIIEESVYDNPHLDDGTLVCEACLQDLLENQRTVIQEAKYHGKTVSLNKPTRGDVKKSKVYVRDPQTGNIVKESILDLVNR